MKLTGMIEAWQQQQSSSSFHDLSFDERFTLLVEREYLRRQNQRLQRRLKQARLPIQATLDAVDFDVPRGIRECSLINYLAANGRGMEDISLSNLWFVIVS